MAAFVDLDPRNPNLHIPWTRVPRLPALLGAIVVHVVLTVMAFVFWRTDNVHLIRPQLEAVQLVPREPLHYQSGSTSNGAGGLHAKASKTRTNAKLVLPIGKGEPSLGERARRGTKNLMASFRFSLNYGFNPGEFSFANQTHGQLPRIEAHEVPYEQYVIVEVTVDVDGSVAEARVVTGKIPTQVADKLVSAIREFRYDPAKKDGIPIPSLLDIVIHVPS